MSRYIEAVSAATTIAEKHGIPIVDLVDTFAEIPAADVAPVRHGRWIEYTKVIIQEPYNKREQAWKCSECGFDDGFIADPFCLSCGARMDMED